MRLTPLIALLACNPDVPEEAPRMTPDAAVAEGYRAFVTAPNAAASGRTDLEDPDVFDEVLYRYVDASFRKHLSSWAVFERLEQVHDDYALVTMQLRKAGLPEVLASVPYLESQYRRQAQSRVCAKGPWQFMPEVGHRTGLTINGCAVIGREDADWAPTLDAPPAPLYEATDYFRGGQCLITQCAVDERTDLEKSTAAAIGMFEDVWTDPEFRASGALVQLTVASHNAGYDDSRFITGRTSQYNLKPAFDAWKRDKRQVDHARFYGANIAASTPMEPHPGASYLSPETQHYAYTVIAQHLVAVCYYAKNHPEEPAFAPWAAHSDGWCSAFAIPDAAMVMGE